MDWPTLGGSLITGLVGGGLVSAIVKWWEVKRKTERESHQDHFTSFEKQIASAEKRGDSHEVSRLSPNPPKDTDGRREDSGRGWVRELQGRWPGVLG